jgi:hypothetical protein
MRASVISTQQHKYLTSNFVPTLCTIHVVLGEEKTHYGLQFLSIKNFSKAGGEKLKFKSRI